ncbi:MAG: peptide deformylase [Candidatus Saccharimonadales bacterium]|jgi:peptide deformylase
MKITEFGNSLLRGVSPVMEHSEIISAATKQLIADMRSMMKAKKLGVGLAAQQVGANKRLSIITIQPTKARPDVETFDLVIINPTITRTFGYRKQMWEGCISSGPGKAGLFAKVPRYKKIELEYTDPTGDTHTEIYTGLAAHVIQHEVDHMNGILFVDRVKDTSTYMTHKEYVKLVSK